MSDSPGSALAKARWNRATEEQRLAVGEMLARARKRAARRRARASVSSQSRQEAAKARK